MNQPDELDPQQLTQATSRQLPAAAALSDETAALREGWLALGKTLDAENAGFQEESLLARLSQADKSASAAVELAGRPAETSKLWPLALGAALALAMMVAVVRTAFYGPAAELIVVTPAPAESPEIVQNDSPTIVPEAEPAIAAWSDPLDDEIERATEQLAARWPLAAASMIH